MNTPVYPMRAIRFSRLATLAMLVPLATGAGQPWAQGQVTRNWNDPAGGVYGTFTDWTPAGVPSLLDTARLNVLVPGDIPISFIQDRVAAELQVVNGDIVLNGSGISPGDRTYTVDDATIEEDGHLILQRVFQERDLNLVANNLLTVQGDLSIRDSALLTSPTAVVDSGTPVSVANAVVSGANLSGDPSRWDVTDLTIGLSNRGELRVEDGATLSSTNSTLGVNADSDGKLIVRGVGADGSPSMWTATEKILVGDHGIATLRVEEGAVVSTPAGALLGKRFDGFGLASVEGVDAAGNPSHWTTGPLNIQGGVINVRQGALLTSQDTSFGVNRPGTISVQGVDQAGNPSTWVTTVAGGGAFNLLTIGRNADATLEILDGANVVSTGPAVIAVNLGINGSVSVGNLITDAISTWTNSGNVFVGGSPDLGGGNGSIFVGGNSRVYVAGTVKVWGTGSLSISGGTLAADRIENTEGGEFAFGSGVLQTNRFEGDLLNGGGTLAPGPAAGTTTIIGDYTQQQDATLAIDIGGTVAGITHDLVNMSGNALFDGQLALTLIDGFTPDVLDEFTVLVANNLFDSFDNVLNGQRLTTTAGDGSFIVNYGIGSAFDESRIILSDFEANAFPPGDFDQDGDVDGGDFLNWQRNDGSAGGLAIWESNFGSSAPPLAALQAVPEPTTCCLLALALGLCAVKGGRSKMPRRSGSIALVTRRANQAGLFVAIMLTGITTQLQAQITRTWTPQGFSRDWHDAANWTPQGVPGGLDDVIHDNGLRPISLVNGPSSGVDNLIVTTGARLFTEGNTLLVNAVGDSGLMEIIGSGSELIVDPRNTPGPSADVDTLEVKVGGNLKMAGGTIWLDRTLFVDSSSRITGHGIVYFDDQDAANPPTVLTMDGTVRASGGTLVLEATADAEVTFNNANLDANFGDLGVDATLSEPYRGVLTVGAGHKFTSKQEFHFDNTATLNLFGGAPEQPATFTSLQTSIGATVNVNGSAVMSVDTRLSKNVLVNLPDPNDHLRLHGQAVISGDILDENETGATFTGTGQIVNETSTGLLLLNKPIIDVPFVNSGPVDLAFVAFIAVSHVSFVEFESFRQTETGMMQYDVGLLGGDVLGDSYSVATTAELDGALEVTLVDNLNAGLPTLAAGDTFKILTAVGGITGEFSSTSFPTPPDGTFWRLNYFSTSVELELLAGLPGDFDNDGDTDGSDFLNWQRNDGSAIGLANWESNFGNSPSPLASSRAIPEPSAALLLLMGVSIRLLTKRSSTRHPNISSIRAAVGPGLVRTLRVQRWECTTMYHHKQTRFSMSSTALAVCTALTVLTMIAPPLRADVVVNPDNNGFADVRFGAGFTLLTNPVANFLDLRPDDLFVGNNFAGELKLFKPIINAGVVQNGNGIIGKGPIANGKVTVEGGSIWNNEGALTVAQQGTGTLDIKSAGQVFATSVTLGDQADSTGTVTIDGVGSRLTGTSTLLVGNGGDGILHITNGGLSTGPLQIGTLANSTGTVTVDGTGSRLETNLIGMTAFSNSTGTLSITNGGVVEVSNGSVTVGPAVGPTSGSEASIVVDGPGSMFTVDNSFFQVGNAGGTGTLDITNGGVVNAGSVNVADDGNGTTGVITVDGSGSQLNVTIGIALGNLGTVTSATLDIRNGGFVSTKSLFVAFDAADNIDGKVFVQNGGVLRVEDGITVLGDLTLAGGTLIFAGDRVYDAAPGDIADLNGVLNPRAGVLSIGETVKIEGQLTVLSPITIDGGGLSAGSIPNIASVDFQRGLLELTGVDLDVTDPGQLGDTVSLGATQHLKISQTVRVATDGRVELSGGRLGAGLFENNGVVTGDGRIDGPLDNTSTGEVRVSSGESLLFTGAGNTNAGDINLLGASDLLGTTLEFEQDLTNSATGRISGRGTLIASGGLTNQGVMALSGGFTDVLGDISVTGGASVEVNGGAVATFHDDFDNNGNVTVSPNSEVVFLGDVTGAGSFFGMGIATFEAALSPGNSPGEVTFDGDVVLGVSATLKLEIGGLAAGTQHDFLDIAGQFSADGTLDIQLLAGFIPGASDVFTLLNAGSLLGQFDNIATGGRLPTTDGGGSFVVNYGATSALADNQLILTNFLVDTGLPGDFDNDGDVDGGDFLKWQRGMSPNPLSGSDLSAWESNFGNVTAPLASAHAVPEPSTAIMLIFAAIGIGYRRCSAGNRVALFPNESLR